MNVELYKEIYEAVSKGESFAVASVIETEGSSPGKPGHKMIVYPDGKQAGTIGGGKLEAVVIDEMLAMIKKGLGAVLTYNFDPDSPEAFGMVCGGKAVIAVEVISGSLNLLLCGGGHVAAALARQCAELGFAYAVADGRDNLTTRERFPAAGELIVEAPDEYISASDLSRYSHIIIFTHDHGLDLAALRAVSEAGYSGYIGLIGSAKKWTRFRKELSAEGVTEKWLDDVHCPIGLEISAHTPAEIALSIAAEIVKESNS
jgi:xanthine dehydrogenase accessory factor